MGAFIGLLCSHSRIDRTWGDTISGFIRDKWEAIEALVHYAKKVFWLALFLLMPVLNQPYTT